MPVGVLRMRRSLSLALDEFGAAALEQQAERFSVSPAEVASRAARYYVSDLDSGRLALRVPRLAKGVGGKPALSLRVELDDDSLRQLDAEATRQDVPVEALLRHAVLYFLADLDSGRVERRMLEDESA
jgi:hypothetical protein